MGVYIKGMEMPKRGESCLVITIMPDGGIYNNVYDASFRVNQIGEAVPVPPHGRLVDADKLTEEIQLFIKENMLSHDDARALLATIDDAPTIIPAEEGE